MFWNRTKKNKITELIEPSDATKQNEPPGANNLNDLPSSVTKLNYPSGVAVDSAGNVYVADKENNCIQKFTSEGVYLKKWGSQGSGNGEFTKPSDITVDNSGKVYVVDSYNNRIQKFTSNGTFVKKWGSKGPCKGEFNMPFGVAIDSSSNIYVADTVNQRIQKFTSDGAFITKWGSQGSKDVNFNRPEGVAADDSGNICVADTANQRIHKFTSDGAFITKWGSQGSEDVNFNRPEGVATDDSSNIYVADTSNHRILKFTCDGAFVTKWGSQGSGNGEFYQPVGVAVDSSGNVYVVDSYNHRIQKFTSEGAFVTKWGSQGSEEGYFNRPEGVAVDDSGNIYVADTSNHRVQKFKSDGTFIQNLSGSQINPYDFALNIIEIVSNEMNELKKQNVIVKINTSHLLSLIDHQNSLKAIEEAQSIFSEIQSLKNDFAEAKTLVQELKLPHLATYFDSGEYDKVISSGEMAYARMDLLRERIIEAEQQYNNIPDSIKLVVKTEKYSAVDQAIEDLEIFLRNNRLRSKIEEAEKQCLIPENIKKVLDTNDYSSIDRSMNELNKIFSRSKPDLEIEINPPELEHDTWQAAELSITNKGDAHAYEITISFSDDIDIKGLIPVSIKAGERQNIEVRIRPKFRGNVPLEIYVEMKNGKGELISEKNEILISVYDYKNVNNPFKDNSGPSFNSGLGNSPSGGMPQELFAGRHYDDVEMIGEGGFARVYRAVHNGKTYAVKVPISMNETTGKTFINEIQNWTQFKHPNIVQVHDYNILPIPYFEMDICEKSLEEYQKPAPPDEATWIIFNICEGLRYAHKQGIIHLDLKPQNILFGTDGSVKISDWGLSKVLTQSGSSTANSFSPHYAAPEQINSKTKSAATDIWQTGVIFYELLTGKLPFGGESLIEVGMSIVQAEPVPPSSHSAAAAPFDAIILKCLEKDPAMRYKSVYELQVDLSKAMNNQYAHLLKKSLTTGDIQKSTAYCGELVLVNLRTGHLSAAHRYATDLSAYAQGEVKGLAETFAQRLAYLNKEGLDEVPDDLENLAELIVHKVRMGFENV